MTSRPEQSDVIGTERRRIEAEYRRRAEQIEPDLYAPWQPWTRLEVEQRVAAAKSLLRDAGFLPFHLGPCLEVGCGTGGWFGALVDWGYQSADIHGVDLSAERLEQARTKFPLADLRLADGCALPWPDSTFRLVVVSVVFTSVLDHQVRRRMAQEIERVLMPGGGLLWYDFAFNNPRNPNVRKVSAAELRSLFPNLRGRIVRVTLAPPIARAIAPRSWSLAKALSSLPWLRTHLVAVLCKRPAV
jgi:SAM-dependent methyltransferase